MIDTSQALLLYGRVYSYSWNIWDVQKSVSSAAQVSLHLPEAQKSKQTEEVLKMSWNILKIGRISRRKKNLGSGKYEHMEQSHL